MVSPVECSLTFMPRKPISWRGLSKRRGSPISLTSTAALINCDPRVALVGLPASACPPRDHRRRPPLARPPGLAKKLPVDPVAERPRLVAHHQRPPVLAQLPDQPIDRRRGIGDLAPVAHLATRQRLRHRNVDVLLVCIQTNVQRILPHDRSPPCLRLGAAPLPRHPRSPMPPDRSPQPHTC